MTISTTMSASENTSVHGPVAPCVRENCSGAPYAGREARDLAAGLGERPRHLLRVVARPWRCRSRAASRCSRRADRRARRCCPGLTSRWAMPLRCASASASAAGSSRRTASVGSSAAAQPPGLLVAEHGLERGPLEPLEHHVGNAPRPSASGASRCRAPARWRRVRADRSASSAPSWMNSSRSFCAVLLGEVAERLEHLERHRALPDDVHRLVDGGEAALADDALDGVLVGDGPTDEL